MNRSQMWSIIAVILAIGVDLVDVKVHYSRHSTTTTNALARTQYSGPKENEHQIVLAEPRYLNLTNFNLTRFLLSVAPTPDTFGNGLVNGIYIATFRTVGVYFLGLAYSKVLETAEPGSNFRSFLDIFSNYFDAGFFSTRLLEPFNLLFGLNLGRFVYLLIVFGPVATFRGIFNTSGAAVIRRQYTFNVGVANIIRFVYTEGIATALGFILTFLVGSFFLMDQDSRRRRRSANFDNTQNVARHLSNCLQRIVQNLEHPENI